MLCWCVVLCCIVLTTGLCVRDVVQNMQRAFEMLDRGGTGKVEQVGSGV